MDDKKEGNKNYLISYSGMDNRRDDEKMEAGTTTPPTECRFENYRTFLFASVHWEELPPPPNINRTGHRCFFHFLFLAFQFPSSSLALSNFNVSLNTRMDKRRDDEKMEVRSRRRQQLDVVLRTIEPFSSLPFIGRNCPIPQT
ncbi:hypothetical protein CEXT_349531 [Caerostris extrusa]|uniref:Uncharacterized protein n=1 Tax=Caerostris extrusa TaxID=172846 RepID=A0AAV4VB16_CAEEX|nr:hypothetical protein CEXT_349531 [Caerostris extrusa]